MSGLDKHSLMEELKALGWQEVEVEGQTHQLIPPQSLWDKKPKSFYVYDAEYIQNILGEETGLHEDGE